MTGHAGALLTAEPEVRPILTDLAVLRQKSLPVEDWTTVRGLIEGMVCICQAKGAYGLSAVQLGELKRVIVINVPIQRIPRAMAFINPEITWRSEHKETVREGCLSLPGIRKDVRRPASIKLKFIGSDGCEREIPVGDLAARAIQHEVDHLNGILIIDRSKGLS